jgi:hypothetical protein
MYYWAQEIRGSEAIAKIVEYWAEVISSIEIDGKVRLAITNDGQIAITAPMEGTDHA